MHDVILIGAGGLTREVLELVAADEPGTERWRVVAVLDDDTSRHGSWIGGVLCVGGRDKLRDFPSAQVIVCTGRPDDNSSRPRIVRELGLPPERYATVVHRSAQFANSVTVGPGTIVLAGVVATADVSVGSHCVLMPQVVLTHDDVLDDYVTCASGVRLGGRVHVGRETYLGAACAVRENTKIGVRSVVGMGSVVLRDVPDDEVWVGNPAQRLRSRWIDGAGTHASRRR